MTAGRRDQKIVIQRGTPITDAAGTVTFTWATHATEWAEVLNGAGSERRQAALEQGQQAATFSVPDNSATRDTTVRDRISYDGGFWDIDGNVLSKRYKGEREITAVRAL